MNERERQKARAELIRGISITSLIDDLAGKPYGHLVLQHVRQQGSNLRMAAAVSVSLSTPEEVAAAEPIIDLFNVKGYDAAFWATDAGVVLALVSCELNDALFPDTADEAGVFNLFQLITQNFAQMAYEQPALKEFILNAITNPPPKKPIDHGLITKMIGIAVADYEAGRLSRSQYLSILQAAIDNGDILLESNRSFAASVVVPLLESGVLRPSPHSEVFEQRMKTDPILKQTAVTSKEPKVIVAGFLLLLVPLLIFLLLMLLNWIA